MVKLIKVSKRNSIINQETQAVDKSMGLFRKARRITKKSSGGIKKVLNKKLF